MAAAARSALSKPSEFDRSIDRWGREPSLREVLLVTAVTGLVFFCVVALFRPFLAAVQTFGDNQAFQDIASAIQHWDFHGLNIKAFWGLPYAMVGVSLLTRMSDRNALLFVSYASGVATIMLAHRLWGGWVAGFFSVLSFDWMERLFLGGSESLFTAFLFGSFLAARRERWFLAALLAALSTIVRPLGIFALMGLGVTLLWKRDWGNFFLALVTGLAVGGLYVAPLALYFQTPLANVQTYQNQDWQGGWLFAWPLRAILQSTDRVPVTNLALTWGWILFVLAGLLALVLSRRCREYWRAHPGEMLFAVGYILFLYTYNSPWARGTFPRLAIPAVPFVLLGLSTWTPNDRRLVWGLAVLSPILAACSSLGIRNVAEIVRRTR